MTSFETFLLYGAVAIGLAGAVTVFTLRYFAHRWLDLAIQTLQESCDTIDQALATMDASENRMMAMETENLHLK